MHRSIRATLQVVIAFIIATCLFFSEGIALAATPNAAEATSTNPTLLASLYAQLATLQAEIAALEATSSAVATSSTPASTSTESCVPLTLSRSLALGSQGSDVSSLQAFLKSEGYYAYPSITGYFGPITEAGIKAFQSASGIEPIGIVGPITRVRISVLSAACESAINASHAPTLPAATSTPAIATTTAATSTSAVPIPQSIPTNNTPGFGGGGGSTSASESPPPDWVLSGAAEDLDFADQQYYSGTLDSLISTSRASPETCNWSDGSVTYAATDTPCITDLGLAVWQGSTNLLEDSGDLSGSAWSNYTTGSGTVSVTGDDGTAPDGTQTAALITVDVTDASYNPTDLAVREQPFAATAAPYSDSIWLKAASSTDVGDVIVLGISTDWWVDSTRVILTDQWQRYSVDDETLSTDGASELFIGYRSARDIPQDGPVSFLAWGAQAEAGPTPTAYIPTASSTASRAADDITASGALASTLASGGGSVNAYTNGSQPHESATIIDADGSALLGKTSDDALTSDVSTALANSNPAAWQGEAVSGLAWDASGRSLALNDAIVSDTQATTPAAPFTIGSSGGSSFFNGYVARLTAWASKVSNATLAAMPNLDNTTYYVAADGNDDNNGTSPSTPWQSVAKVNAGTYYPGDQILFEGSDTFTGCLRFYGTNTFGTTTDPILVSSYGAGRFTLDADCQYYKSEGVYLEGVGGFTLDNAILAGNGSGTWFGVRIENFTSRVVSGITIENSDISGFYETVGSDGDGSEIEIDGYPGAGLDQVNVLDNTLHGNEGPTSPDRNGIKGYPNGTIPNVNLTNFTVEGNTVYDIGGGSGILLNGVNGGVVEDNVAHDIGANTTSCGGPVGIWAYNSNDITIQYNEAYRVEPVPYTTGCDWDGFDLDGDTTNSTMQYNYSHDNWGAGYLLYIPGSSNNTVRNNIAENNATTTAAAGYGGVTITNGSESGFDVYNNTIFSDGPAGTSLFTIDYGNPASTTVANNIFYSTNGANLLYTVGSSNPGSVTLIDNDYYASGPFKISWAGKTYTSLAAFQAST
ncbi:MAG: peptidoglycan-binding protein, partial [Xanthobacteraceae bacterium]